MHGGRKSSRNWTCSDKAHWLESWQVWRSWHSAGQSRLNNPVGQEGSVQGIRGLILTTITLWRKKREAWPANSTTSAWQWWCPTKVMSFDHKTNSKTERYLLSLKILIGGPERVQFEPRVGEGQIWCLFVSRSLDQNSFGDHHSRHQYIHTLQNAACCFCSIF